MLLGLQKSDMIVVAARPSMGKTAFSSGIIEWACINNKVETAVFSLEMSKQAMMQRLFCSLGRVDSQRVRKGKLSGDDHKRLAEAADRVMKAPMWIDDTGGATILDIRAKCRHLKKASGLRLVVIDYLQLMDGRGESDQVKVSNISRGAKALAREMDCPVVVLSQLNRNAESREGHRPKMSDLRSSGAIEQDADVVMLLHREDYYKKDEKDYVKDNLAEVIVAKQRNGPTGTIKLVFNDQFTSFGNLSSAAIETF